MKPAWAHSAFYRFAPIRDPVQAAQAVREAAAQLLGAIIVAEEGINGAVCGPVAFVERFEAWLGSAACEEGVFVGIQFKRSACDQAPFARLKVLVKPEIVRLKVPLQPSDLAQAQGDDSHLSPTQWQALLGRDDVVVLDNRNHFEVRLGRFKGAVDPQVDRFSDFVSFVQDHAPQWKAQGKTVAMYCTGGIRCDKSAPWMRSLGLQVWQLEGGILNYFAQIPEAQNDWQGQCFVFDKRMAVDTQLQPLPVRAADVFDAQRPQERWRLERAERLDRFGV